MRLSPPVWYLDKSTFTLRSNSTSNVTFIKKSVKHLMDKILVAVSMVIAGGFGVQFQGLLLCISPRFSYSLHKHAHWVD